MKVTTVKIDVTKIDKNKLYRGEKGTYLDAAILWNDSPDKYGNDGMVVQSVSKEDRDKGIKGAILGNVKNVGQSKPEQVDTTDDGDDSLPF